MDTFDNALRSAKPCNAKRVITFCRHEVDQPLQQEHAYGHRMMIAGLYPNQYVWCELCNAYTGSRAQKLTKVCTGKQRPNRAVSRLNRGLNPDDATPLVTLPRRMSRRDIGLDTLLTSNDTGMLLYNSTVGARVLDGASLGDSLGDVHLDYRDPSSVQTLATQLCCDEEDPFDHGTSVG